MIIIMEIIMIMINDNIRCNNGIIWNNEIIMIIIMKIIMLWRKWNNNNEEMIIYEMK